jgi:hypothetical protein
MIAKTLDQVKLLKSALSHRFFFEITSGGGPYSGFFLAPGR